jgi:hypothetical protein
MDLDSDYYWSRCRDINGLWVFKGTFMTFVGGDSDHWTLFHFNIEELFTVLQWRCSYSCKGANCWSKAIVSITSDTRDCLNKACLLSQTYRCIVFCGVSKQSFIWSFVWWAKTEACDLLFLYSSQILNPRTIPTGQVFTLLSWQVSGVSSPYVGGTYLAWNQFLAFWQEYMILVLWKWSKYEIWIHKLPTWANFCS